MSALAIEVRLSLSAHFQLECAFEIPSGFSVLFGPSGAGKTSVLDCIAGLKTPDSGRITLHEQRLFDRGKVDLSPEERKVAYVFQSLALFPHLTVIENVAYGLQGKRATNAERCRQILVQFGIDHLSSRRPGLLSGGERQRVALARSLVTNPQALLLDEPLTALDRTTRIKILDDLRDWNSAHGVPILYVTHSAREALALGERVLIMERGRIVATGTPSKLLDAEEWD